MLGLLHHTQTDTPVTQAPSGQCAPENHPPQFLSLWSAGKLGSRCTFFQTDQPTVSNWRPWLGHSWACPKRAFCFCFCFFFSPLYRGLEQETPVTTHLTRCSVLCNVHVPIYLPITHTKRRQYAKHRKKKKISTDRICWAANWSKGLWGLSHPWHSGKAPPSLLFSLSLSHSLFELQPHAPSFISTWRKQIKSWHFHWSKS